MNKEGTSDFYSRNGSLLNLWQNPSRSQCSSGLAPEMMGESILECLSLVSAVRSNFSFYSVWKARDPSVEPGRFPIFAVKERGIGQVTGAVTQSLKGRLKAD